MKTLIKNKIDRLQSKGHVVEKTKKGYNIDRIHAYLDSEYMPAFFVENTDLNNDEAREIYNLLENEFFCLFNEYLKGD